MGGGNERKNVSEGSGEWTSGRWTEMSIEEGGTWRREKIAVQLIVESLFYFKQVGAVRHCACTT